jgi:hypothetical protein
MVVVFIAASTSATSFVWNNPHPFPPMSTGTSFIAACLMILGFALYFHMESVSEEKTSSTSGSRSPTFSKVPAVFYLGLLILFLVRASLWLSRSTYVSYHPIELLMYEAQASHAEYRAHAAHSRNIVEAVRTYKLRYGRHPPPGFQHWYEYATARNSVVIDIYDRINEDMLPFYALSPAEIRQRTWAMISNPWNDAAGISIRDHQVSISENVVPTHRWMLDGVVEMISKFAEFLPDMDLAFNLNDECRVTVPWEDIELMRRTGAAFGGLDQTPKNLFSNNRAEGWQAVPEEPNGDSPLKAVSFHRTFYDFGNIGCPTKSPARTQRIWDFNRLCTACAAPHSLGAFLANWTLAGDICHQPDLADLHGLYLSPAAYKGTHELYPIFSQSKAHGYNDILYPSAWNYMDKAKYDPSDEHPDPVFSLKNNTTVFWRGATSEGVSPGQGQWRGMSRQRFIHNANNINGSEPEFSLLLPAGGDGNRMSYKPTHIRALTNVLSTDIHIVDFIARCGGKDCGTQANEFAALVAPTDFQSHWQYKYLLDLDGAGFSGRFLPFLQSHSLPFKAALFREWWDERVTPWWHFVPLDLRGHGFWATLAYFAGIHADSARQSGVGWGVPAHESEAAQIAHQGKKWAEQALRKEDMEIYFFRLLLEWGRLTDDRREELGFVPQS